jgi:two-component system, response regulator
MPSCEEIMALNRKFVLLISDCPDEQALTTRALRQGGIQDDVTAVSGGDEAMEFLEGAGRYADRNVGHLPSLIMIDLTSPHVEGHRILGQLRGSPRSRLIPVVVLMSSFEKQDLNNGFGRGANSLVVKPVKARELAETLGQVVRYWLGVNEAPH